MVGIVGVRVTIALVGVVGLLVFVGAGFGTGPLASVTGPPPCSPTCAPRIYVAPPQVTSTGLNASIVIFGSVAPPRLVALATEVISIQGANTLVSIVNSTSNPLTGQFTLLPFSYKAAAAGSYTVFSTITGTVSTTHVTVTATSPAVTFTVKPAASGNTTTQCGSGGCPTVTPGFTFAGFGLKVFANDTSTVTNATSSSVTFTWGDGIGPVTQSVGQSATHTYATTGVYTVTDTVTATSSTGVKATGSVSVTISVAPTGFHNGTTSTNASGTTIAPTGFTPLTDSGIGISLGLLVMGATGRWKEGAILIVGLGIGGYFVGPLL